MEEDEKKIDFAFFYYIGRNKLGFNSFAEVGRITLTLFHRLYDQYKNCWDNEMMLLTSRTTYRQAYIKAQKSEEWF